MLANHRERGLPYITTMSIQASITPDYFIPLLVSISFYALIFGAAEVIRRVNDRVFSPKRHFHAFFMEFAACIQMCTCVYENGVILKNYGVIGFFFTVIGLLIVGGIVNRGAFVNPLPVFELLYKNAMSLERAIVILSAQLLGGGFAFKLANNLWYLSMDLIDDHRFFYENLPCTFVFKHSLVLAMIYEVAGCFCLRFIGSRLHGSAKGYLMPAMVSFLLSVAFVYIGVPALNPLTTSARMMNCKGLPQDYFFITYWFFPAFGWFAAVFLDDYLSKRPSPQQAVAQKQDTRQKKQEKNEDKKKWYNGSLAVFDVPKVTAEKIYGSMVGGTLLNGLRLSVLKMKGFNMIIIFLIFFSLLGVCKGDETEMDTSEVNDIKEMSNVLKKHFAKMEEFFEKQQRHNDKAEQYFESQQVHPYLKMAMNWCMTFVTMISTVFGVVPNMRPLLKWTLVAISMMCFVVIIVAIHIINNA